MSENRSAAPMRVSVVGPYSGQVASTCRGAEMVRVETADVGLFYLHVPVMHTEPSIQVGEPTLIYPASMRVDEADATVG
jgi:hypothetical protein